MKTELSEKLFARAQQLFPGGVNSPVRAFRGVGGTPRFIRRARGSHVTDVDGNDYVDYVLSWGPLIAGHCHPQVMRAVQEALQEGSSFGAPSPREIALAELVQERMPWLERMRFCSSGTEATTAAIRVARGFTGRDDLVKFDGCYHGAGDSLLVKAGSGVETLGLPDSPGVPADLARHTLTLPFNDPAAAEALFAGRGSSIAGVIVEPVVGNMGVLVPGPGYLERLAALCREHGALFIVDEVMTGFRLGPGGACGLYGLRPDLVTFGKVIGGGLPVGAFGGRAEVMDRVAPAGPIYQAGTLSGNPMAMAAGKATLELLAPEAYQKLEATSARLAEGLAAAAARAGVPVQVNRVGSMLTVFFGASAVFDAASARACSTRRFAAFHG
ncbi:MAG TPA: glutamate-1-semialdehyde 2,1-aminomutase, partial [Anaeromyxobacter sp.]|nr:glutamate-1-semialdehyde 2,1-aminomutase [Anaeromyxobacter sp.]